VGENAPLLWGLIATAIYEHGLEEIEVTLREDPNLLEKKDWVDLAEQLSVPKVAADFISIDKEQIWFDDMLQRSFTDDGMGNGRFTPQGMHYFLAGIRSDEPRLLTKAAVHPALSLLVPSRKRLVQQHEHLIEQASANLKVPMRSANWERVRKEMQASRESFLDSINPVSISQFADYSFVQASLERLLGRRDGLVVGIALELYRREHGMYPQTLDVLVPEYLPSVPTDRITGDPTRYRTVNGKPVVYSVGFDRDDDGGRATAALAQRTSWPTSARDVLDGDWMLFPSEYTRRIH
jgi:hypothetical protein